MRLEDIGAILAGGWGDKILLGIAVGLLEESTPGGCYEWIRDNRSLLEGVSDEDWTSYKEIAQNVTIDLTADSIIAELKKHRLDLLGVILNHPEGRNWLDRQVAEIKKRLGIK